jgi:uncharacterized membrane protein YfcA
MGSTSSSLDTEQEQILLAGTIVAIILIIIAIGLMGFYYTKNRSGDKWRVFICVFFILFGIILGVIAGIYIISNKENIIFSFLLIAIFFLLVFLLSKWLLKIIDKADKYEILEYVLFSFYCFFAGLSIAVPIVYLEEVVK